MATVLSMIMLGNKVKIICWVSRAEFVSLLIFAKIEDAFQTILYSCMIAHRQCVANPSKLDGWMRSGAPEHG